MFEMEIAYGLPGKVARLACLGVSAVSGYVSITAASAAPSLEQDRLSITRSMQDSADAWSRSDLNGYMKVYEQSPDTVYLTANKVVRGYDAIKTMYASRFKPMQPMGHLSLIVLNYRALGSNFGLLLGRYELARPNGAGSATGVFTLTFHRTSSGWRIISDHTSS